MTENSVENEDIKCIERILRIYEQNRTISIEEIDCTAGCLLGENYMSVVKRVQVSGTSDEEEDYCRSLIVKRQIACTTRRQLFRCDEAFSNEIAAYSHLVPAFQEFTVQTNLPYPICLYAGMDDYGELVVMEDLRETGYKMVDRLKGLDYAHCKVVMQKLAILHAISLAMKCYMPEEFEEARKTVKEIVYTAEGAEFYTHMLDTSVGEALSSLRMTNTDGTLDAPIRKIEKLRNGRIYKIMSEKVTKTDDKWSVMCHGDIWVTNVMFRYNANDMVDDVKLIDLQTLRYTSPVIDIIHFLYTSTESELRKNYLDKLLSIYIQTLISQLRIHIKSQETLAKLESEFTLVNLRKHFTEKIMYGLGISMWTLPAVTFHPDRIPDLNSITLSDFTSTKQEKMIAQMQTPEYHKRLREMVLEFYDNGYLDGIV